MSKSKRTMQERGDSVKAYAAGGGVGGGILGGLADYRSQKKWHEELAKGFGHGPFGFDLGPLKANKKDLALGALKGAIAGAASAGLWNLGSELGGSMHDDSYTSRLIGGFAGNPILGVVGSPLTALQTYLIQEKNKKR